MTGKEPSPPDADSRRHRRVRSFVRRPGRLTTAQQRALDELLPEFEIDPDAADVSGAFDHPQPLVVEIGFGNGEALGWMAANEPGKNFIGIEVHEPGVGRLLRDIHDRGLKNVRVAMRDAVEVLAEQVPADGLHEARIYFPDPWPKKRHHKRRLIQPHFVELAAGRVKRGGHLHCATDWEDYAAWMMAVLDGCGALENTCGPGRFAPRPSYRPRTKYERRGEGLGHGTWDLVFRKV